MPAGFTGLSNMPAYHRRPARQTGIAVSLLNSPEGTALLRSHMQQRWTLDGRRNEALNV
jgi:hypothetical protein